MPANENSVSCPVPGASDDSASCPVPGASDDNDSVSCAVPGVSDDETRHNPTKPGTDDSVSCPVPGVSDDETRRNPTEHDTDNRQLTTDNPALSPPQTRALMALVAGRTITQAAEAAGVSRQTVSGWCNDDKHPFAMAYSAATAKLWQDTLSDLANAFRESTGHVLAVLRDENSDPKLKLQCALGIIKAMKVSSSHIRPPKATDLSLVDALRGQ